MTIVPCILERLTALQTLINAHLEMAISGWALPAEYIAERLICHPEQHIGVGGLEVLIADPTR